MTTIKVIGSSSSGNGYIIQCNNSSIIIELGCNYSDYFNAADTFPIAAICSHKHKDHINKSNVKQMQQRGVDIYVGEKVYNELDGIGEFGKINVLLDNKKALVGGFYIQPFEVAHNVPNYGFLIETPAGERIVFVTDAIECNYKFKDIDCIMIECNHDDETMIDNLDRNEVGSSHPENHLGLYECVNFCKNNLSAHLKQIILLHMSSANINESYALSVLRNALPTIPIDVARKGNEYAIDNDNF